MKLEINMGALITNCVFFIVLEKKWDIAVVASVVERKHGSIKCFKEVELKITASEQCV